MKKILIVINTAFVRTGGLTTVMMNYYRAMDKEGLAVDFASSNEPDRELLEELADNNSRYFRLPVRGKNILPYFRKLLQRCREYDAVHVNGCSSTMAVELAAARLAGVPVRIAHCHSAGTAHPMLDRLLHPLLCHTMTLAAACSKAAGESLYGGMKYLVLNNALDTEKYRFSEAAGNELRRELGIADEAFVMGHVGKIYGAKNHEYLLDIFLEVRKKRQDAVLLLVGDGVLRERLEQKIAAAEAADWVIITGLRTDVSRLLSAMDIFVFPSVYEGMPLALVEAQANGLKCVASERISGEASILDSTECLSIDVPAAVWAERVLNGGTERTEADIVAGQFRRKGFDIGCAAGELKKVYLGQSPLSAIHTLAR